MRNLVYLALACAIPLSSCSSEGTCIQDIDCPGAKICKNDRCVEPPEGDNYGVVAGDSAAGDSAFHGGDRHIGGDPFIMGDTNIQLPDGNVVTRPDITPPEITILFPSPYQLVSGHITIRARVKDRESALLGDQVEARVGQPGVDDVLHLYMRRREGYDHQFKVAFDTNDLGLMAYPVVIVTAYDQAGNRGEAGHAFALDNRPPIVGLESPSLQGYRDGEEGDVECSEIFPPLGPHAVRHGDIIDRYYYYGPGFYPRVRIRDRGNAIFPNAPVPAAGIDNSTTFLYMLEVEHDGSGERLVLGDGPRACTHINPAVVPDPINPQPGQAIVQTLVPVKPEGEPDFSQRRPPTHPTNPEPEPYFGLPCTVFGLQDQCRDDATSDDCYEAPTRLCNVPERILVWYGTADLTGSGSGAHGTPTIYVAGEHNPDSLVSCIGGLVDANNFTKDGPVCVAAVASDNLGFTNVSPPIAICVEIGFTAVDDCASFNADAVADACSDGCATRSNADDWLHQTFDRALCSQNLTDDTHWSVGGDDITDDGVADERDCLETFAFGGNIWQ